MYVKKIKFLTLQYYFTSTTESCPLTHHSLTHSPLTHYFPKVQEDDDEEDEPPNIVTTKVDSLGDNELDDAW